MENQNQNVNPVPPTSQINQAPPVSNQINPPAGGPKSKLPLVAIIGIILFLLLAGSAAGFYFFNQQTPKQIACTMEAKICPDGTSVGRSGPKCEFTPCPTVKASPTPNPTANWKTYTNNKYSFELKLPLSYTNIQESENKVSFAEDKLGSGGIFVNYGTITDYTSIKPCIEVYKEISKNPGIRPNCLSKDIEKIKIGGIDAVRMFIENTGMGGTADTIQTSMPPKMEISTWYAKKGIFDQILSTFKFTDQSVTPTPTCMLRPACLDATPRCMIAEPASGWCPTSQTSCNSDADCGSDSSCMTAGPLIAGQAVKKICVQKGSTISL